MQYGFYFNGRRCTGCKTCVLACKDLHDLPSSIAFRQVYEYGGGSWRRQPDGTVTQDTFCYYVSVACNHCGNPACVRVCPTGAMHKDERGLVSVDAARCIGCGYCALSCPYRAPKVDRDAGRSVKCDGCTRRVADCLVYTSHERRMRRDERARRDFDRILHEEPFDPAGVYMLDLMREG